MLPRLLSGAILAIAQYCSLVAADCDSYSPAFPLPKLPPNDNEIKQVRDTIQAELDKAWKVYGTNVSSYSIAITSQTETLFDFHHTALDRDEHRLGAKQIDGSTCYRIASNTKAFTVLAILQQQKAGKLNLDDPVNKHLPELDKDNKGSLPWKDITIRTLATQLSGIPRDMGVLDMFSEGDPNLFGLPPINGEDVFTCDSLTSWSVPCTTDDLIAYLKTKEPVFAPKQQSTYSNLNYDLLGLVIERVSGVSYSTYVEKHILKELNMKSTAFSKPDDAVAALVKNATSGWDQVMDVQRPTGGLYSSSDDMAKWARYVLTHYNGLTPATNWLQPASYSTGMKSFTGMPWEIYRTNSILPQTSRPVTFVTKGGGWPGYTSIVAVVPEYGFGFFAVTAGSTSFTMRAASIVGEHMVKTAESLAQRQISDAHTGTFSAPSHLRLNSTITIAHSVERGLYVASWISNSSDVVAAFVSLQSDTTPDAKYHLQLVPTLLFKDEKHQQGEIWRLLTVRDKPSTQGDLFEDFCITDTDARMYGSVPLTELIFWSAADDDGPFAELEITAWHVKMERDGGSASIPLRNHDGAAGQKVMADQF